MSVDLKALKQGSRRALAKAITLVESTLEIHREDARQMLDAVLPYTGNSIRIGVSGIPGVGKSTFIESFGLYLIAKGKKVAVLAVDPSSPLAGGSLLGDKTRMEDLSREENAFIRPSPSSGALGGVAQKTRESMLLCEAAGYDVILVETVGVGQSEYEVAAMVDFFLVLMIPNAGDELQGIKKGIMELVDGLVINKADGESVNLAKRTQGHYQNAFHLMQGHDGWNPEVVTCSALEQNNLEVVWDLICRYQQVTNEAHTFQSKRERQSIAWMEKLVIELLMKRLNSNPAISELKPKLEGQVVEGKTTPYNAALRIMDLL
ncbi:MAG: methylmalonyl Co-A mutase-associated GTPase MeaB [Pseudomonadales bacterium]